ncbi:iron(III) transport system ATP-binding protein [Neorhizobium huautlense]|uniref:Iron(III) transport system ATP-binding protein n=1 Tax=Neorhizobium huautlense TaxID=67774 RepID=A0ABT9PPU8_9HYPH|nr:ABC transporter ATP-binding protein [Neorhizobium huautlense]MDP9836501.1 iron(III) transport system ATP-binding protein [Neorhizobium huautlense]
MPDITLTHVTKNYGSHGQLAVDGLNLTIANGEFMCLLGPSGCGKTTTLRMIAGLEHLSDGEIRIGDRVVDSLGSGTFVPPEQRRLGLVFQSYALWPHMTVERNIDFGLRLRKLPEAERRAKVNDVMEKLRIRDYAKRYPAQLSGGQQQRVALARMLAVNPDILLLDEPLSNLDATLRLEMRAELRRLHEEFGTTIVFVTHDQWEAMTLATTIAVMNGGRLQQVGAPDDIYSRPVNRFVAEFIGNPPINMIDLGDTSSQGGLASRLFSDRPLAGATAVGIRPEEITLVPNADAVPLGLLRLESIMPTGGSWIMEFSLGAERLFHATHLRPMARPGDMVACFAMPEGLHLFDAKGRRIEENEIRATGAAQPAGISRPALLPA